MKNENSKNNYSDVFFELLDSLSPTFEEMMEASVSQTESELKENGFDKAVAEKTYNEISAFLSQHRLDIAKAKREEFAKNSNSSLIDLKMTFEEMKEFIKKYISALTPEEQRTIAVNYRDFEELTKDDLKSLYVDLKRLEMLRSKNV